MARVLLQPNDPADQDDQRTHPLPNPTGCYTTSRSSHGTSTTEPKGRIRPGMVPIPKSECNDRLGLGAAPQQKRAGWNTDATTTSPEQGTTSQSTAPHTTHGHTTPGHPTGGPSHATSSAADSGEQSDDSSCTSSTSSGLLASKPTIGSMEPTRYSKPIRFVYGGVIHGSIDNKETESKTTTQ